VQKYADTQTKISFSLFLLFQSCDNLVDEVKKEYELERDISANKLREVSGRKISCIRTEIFNSVFRCFWFDLSS